MKVTIDTGVAPYSDAWAGFRGEEWKNAVNVRDFIQHNYTPYEGDEAFLAQATPATTALWQKVMVGIRQENATHAPVDFDTNIATTITAHGPGYIDQDLETIVGLQTDKPLKRALHPYGGINMIRSSFEAYGREMDPQFEYLFTDLRKTHNQGVFDVYSPEMMRCRKSGVLTGCRTATGADASSVTIAAWRCTGSLIWCASANCSLPICRAGWSAVKIWRRRSACVKSWRSTGARCCRSSRWRRTMALIFHVRR
jgi:pyruvate-formate lyase